MTVVEDPNPDVFVRIDNEDNDRVNKNNNDDDDDADHTVDHILLPQGSPITSKIRTTVRHLRARCGRWSLLRGLGLFILYNIAQNIIASIFTLGASRKYIIAHALAKIAADVVLATVDMAWVHIVISEPSPKPLRKRVLGYRNWIKIAPAVGLKAVASQLSFVLPLYLSIAVGLSPFDDDGKIAFNLQGSAGVGILKALAPTLLSIALVVLVEIPATVTMVRVAASMLPEEDETVVPFDRSFGGKVTPAVVGGAGKIGLLDAWKTFTWPSRMRLLKLLAKVFGIMVGVTTICGAIIAVEALALAGDFLNQVLRPSQAGSV